MSIKFKYLNDLGNAEIFVSVHGQNIRYCCDSAKWLVWDGKRWMKDKNLEIHRRAKETTKKMLVDASKVKDDDRRKILVKHSLRTQSERGLKALIAVAQSEQSISVQVDKLDSDPWLLNVANGTLDLTTGKLRSHRREDLITKIIPVRYDPKATCPIWDAFLERIMEGNQDLIRFLQKAVGYSLTGNIGEQVIFIFDGTGANGKSTFITTVLSLLGDYAQQTPTETLLSKKGNGIPNDIARLKGARFVAAVEAEQGRQLAEVLVKQLTGGDKITARYLYQEFFEFDATFKLFLAVNHKPKIKGNDNAIWRRIRLVPFNVTIPVEERDKQLGEKLRKELPGILRWAVEGCLLWQQEGLGVPNPVMEATNEYRSEMDVIADFISECCKVDDPEAKTPFNELYRRYINWCSDRDEAHLSHKDFAQELTARGFPSGRNKNHRLRVGIRLSGDM